MGITFIFINNGPGMIEVVAAEPWGGRNYLMDESSEPSSWIFDADEANVSTAGRRAFSPDAGGRSTFGPPWCQPCRLLGPVLEKLAADYDGKFVLVKAEIEKLPAIAAGFGVESIPAVYALADGSLLDFFVGAAERGQLRAWIDRLLPSPAEMLVTEARGLDATARERPKRSIAKRSSSTPTWRRPRSAWPRCCWPPVRTDEALAIVDELEARAVSWSTRRKSSRQLHLHA